MNRLIIATHQPNYIPWLGYFYKLYNCDIFVFLDNVQFSKTGAHNYHYIKTPKGQEKLKIPVKHRFNDPINIVKTNDSGGWKNRHLLAIEQNYGDAPFFEEVFSGFKNVLLKDYTDLAELNISIIKFFMKNFKFKTRLVKASELEIDLSLKGEDRIIDICRKLNATTYYSGKGAKAYQNEANFMENGIQLMYDDFSPVAYDQLWNGEFIHNVSILDYVMNYGYNWDYIFKKVKKDT